MAFKKGQSGNPGGRPKEAPEVKELARSYAAEAIETLAKHMRGDDVRTSVAASQALLDRGFGKPAQALEVSGELKTSDITDEQLDANIRRLAAQAGISLAIEREGSQEIH